MDMTFLKMLNMSISASWLVLAVLALRILLKKSPKWIHVALWALVAVRLICPFSIESVLSLIPSSQTVPQEILYAQEPAIDSGVEILDNAVNSSVMAGMTPEPGASVNPIQIHLFLAEIVWYLGMAVMLAWSAISYFRLKRKVAPSIDLGDGVFICDYIDTPFILGIVKPKIYLPSAMEPDSASHVLAHERAHIARKDHWWKPFGYLLLTVYWFNPLLWLAYILLCRDIELACDEKVIRDMEIPQKKAYSEALLRCSVSRRHVAACPLAFGEVGVKERVKTVLNYKKPAFWIVLVALLALVVTAVCFLTDPVKKEDITYRVEEVVYRNPALSYYMTEEEAPLFQLTQDYTLRRREDGGEWEELGKFSEIQLSDLNFDALFWGLELKRPWTEAYEAWILTIPPEDTLNSTPFYLLLRQEGGLYLGEGVAFTNVYPRHKNILDATMSVNWLYRLVEADSAPEESPYAWTSSVTAEDILFCAASLGDGDWAANAVEGPRLEKFVKLLNQLQKSEIHAQKPAGPNDPLYNYSGLSMHLYVQGEEFIGIRFVDDTLILSPETDTGRWTTDGYWVIENQELKDWLRILSWGNTQMLTEENREEIRQLLRMEYVEFFTPQEYDDLLFVGCAWDHDRGMGVAVYEKVAYGYKLLKLIRNAEVKRCASGSDLYYCDYNYYRIFLVMNQDVTAMEWSGACEKTYAIDSHPGLVVEYFPQNLGAMYRFRYQGGTTMYMDWENKTHAQVPDYTEDVFADPDDAFRVCRNLRLEQIRLVWATEMEDVDNGYTQEYSDNLDSGEIVKLLLLLHDLPEDAFAVSECPEGNYRRLDIELYNYTGQPQITPALRFRLYEDAVYYQLLPDGLSDGKSWRIDSPKLVEFISSFFAEDKSQWSRSAPVPKIVGEVSCDFDGMEVYVPKLAAFEYIVTEEGIRFKPEKEDGYILVRYCDEDYDYTTIGKRTFSGIYGGLPGLRVFDGNEEIWSFTEVLAIDPVWYVPKPDVDNMPSMNVRFVNEDKAAWVEEYEDQIGYIITGMRIHVNG